MSGLSGKRVLVTRPRSQAQAMVERLTVLGAVPVIFPTIEIAEPEDYSRLDRAIAGLGAYTWVIFTSANGVSAFWRRLETLGKDSRAFEGIRTAAIGPATAGALRQAGIEPDFVPGEFVAEAILPGLGDVRGQRILLPRAEIARPALVNALERGGAFPDEIAVYRTLPAAGPSPDLRLQALAQGIDAATFTSSSTVRSFMEILGEDARKLLDGAVIACIGPITAETAHALGLTVDVVSTVHTADGLVDALLDYYSLDSVRKNP